MSKSQAALPSAAVSKVTVGGNSLSTATLSSVVNPTQSFALKRATFDAEGAIPTAFPGSVNRRFKVLKPGDKRTATEYTLRTDLTPVLWQQDHDVTKCAGCKREFGWFLLRHHCRCCGLCLCDSCTPIRAEYSDERVCRFCVEALAQLNAQAQKEVKERLEAGDDATKQLKTILPRFYTERFDIIQEEDAARAIMTAQVRTDRRQVGLEIKDRIKKVVGEVAEILPRRNKPVFGVRGGLLTVRVQRLRNLQPVKPYNTCAPFVFVDIDHEEKRAPVAANQVCPDCQARHYKCTKNFIVKDDELTRPAAIETIGAPMVLDFNLEHVFLFDVEDDSTGLLIWIVDPCSIPGVSVFLGIAHINIRQQGMLLAKPDKIDPRIQNIVRPYIKEQTNEDIALAEAELEQHKKEHAKRVAAQQKQLLQQQAKESAGLLPSATAADAEHAPDVDGSKSHVTDQEDRIQAALAMERRRAYGKGGIGAVAGVLDEGGEDSDNSQARLKPGTENIRVHKRDDFLNVVEHGAVDVPLVDHKPQSTMAAAKDDAERNTLRTINQSSIRVLWTFHPFKQSTESREARALRCEGCKEKDLPGFCSCDYSKKEHLEEKKIARRMEEKAKELYTIEMAARLKQAKARGEKFELPNETIEEKKTYFCC